MDILFPTGVWVAIIGGVVLPVSGFLINGFFKALKMRFEDQAEKINTLANKVEGAREESIKWHAEAAERFARRDDVRESFQQLKAAIDRMDDKMERLLHRGEP